MGFSYNVSVLNQKGSPAIYTDTFANRPNFGYAGRLFIANDTSAIYEDTGTAWVLIANVSSGAGTLQQVTTNGNTSNVGISVTAGGISTNSLTDTALTLGSVLFAGAAGLVTQDNAAFYWDDTNNRLGINTVTPGNTLDLHFAGTGSTIGINNTAGNAATIVFANTNANKWRIGNSSTNTFDVINISTATNAISINGSTNLVSLIGALNAVGSITSQSNGSTFGTSGNGALPLIVQANAVARAIQFKNTSAATGYIAATGTASTMNFSFGTFSTDDAFIINNDGSASHSGDLSLTKGTTRNLNFYDNLAVNINAQIQYSEVNSNTGQLSFLTNNAGTLGTKLTITQNGDVGIGTTNPLKILHIAKGGNVNGILFTDDAAGNYRNEINNTYSSVNAASNLMTFKVSDATTTGQKTVMTLNGVGNVLINSTVDDTVNKLQVTGSSTFGTPSSTIQKVDIDGGSANNPTVNLRGGASSSTFGNSARFTLTDGTNSRNWSIQSNASQNLSLWHFNSGWVNVGNFNNATGIYTPTSDFNKKKDFENSEIGLNAILNLKPTLYRMISENKNSDKHLGFIAQEVKEFIPQAFIQNDDFIGLDFQAITTTLVKAMQEQQNIIDGLLKRIELLENK
jgi:hypothetical protein